MLFPLLLVLSNCCYYLPPASYITRSLSQALLLSLSLTYSLSPLHNIWFVSWVKGGEGGGETERNERRRSRRRRVSRNLLIPIGLFFFSFRVLPIGSSTRSAGLFNEKNIQVLPAHVQKKKMRPREFFHRRHHFPFFFHDLWLFIIAHFCELLTVKFGGGNLFPDFQRKPRRLSRPYYINWLGWI